MGGTYQSSRAWKKEVHGAERRQRLASFSGPGGGGKSRLPSSTGFRLSKGRSGLEGTIYHSGDSGRDGTK